MNGILLTFDDGFTGIYEYAFPILLEEKIPALVTVVSGFAGKRNDWDITMGKSFIHLSWDMVKEMHSYGVNIGSHSHLHPDYSRISEEKLENDLINSIQKISDKIGEKVEYLSYPFGRIREEQLSVVKKMGFKRAFTSVPVFDSNPFFTGRWGVYTIDNIVTLTVKTGLNSNGFLRWMERKKCRTINMFSNGTGIIKSFIKEQEAE